MKKWPHALLFVNLKRLIHVDGTFDLLFHFQHCGPRPQELRTVCWPGWRWFTWYMKPGEC